YTGKVKVTADTQNELLITPGLRCTKDKLENLLVQNTFDASGQSPEWTNGKFVFEDQPLQIVIEELQRQYNIHVNMEAGIGQLRYTGLFESGDLEKALYLVTWPLHLRSSIKGTTVSITR
ncbi:MAG TPA: FecR domain-containing protein, partial [Saprospiraceae bacterium]|nr:FecR domain-containing protein [Saprospiraceae bacterium]